MPIQLNRRGFILTAAAASTATTAFAEGATHEVQMLNQNPDNPRERMVFSPRVLVVQPGDTVKFVNADRGHNSEALEDMVPEGTEMWKGAINEEVSVTLDQPGFYGYKCTPHQSVGMVGLVIVEGEGMMDNFEAAKGVRQRGKAKQVWEAIWEEVDGLGLSA